MHHFVMREDQYKIFAEGIDESERNFVLMIAAVNRIEAEILQSVVDPAHIPFQTKPQPAEIGRLGHTRPCRRLLGNREDTWMVLMHLHVKFLEESDGLQILVAAILVGNPFALLTRIIQIQYGRDGIDPQSVNMISIKPKQGAVEQEVPHLHPTEVKNAAVPLWMVAQTRIFMIVEMRAVEPR